jgi:hypothetical protein
MNPEILGSHPTKRRGGAEKIDIADTAFNCVNALNMSFLYGDFSQA